MAASFCHQPLVGQPPSRSARNQRFKTFRGMRPNVAVIQAESELVDIASRVACADVMERAVDPTLENGPDTLHAVNRNVAV